MRSFKLTSTFPSLLFTLILMLSRSSLADLGADEPTEEGAVVNVAPLTYFSENVSSDDFAALRKSRKSRGCRGGCRRGFKCVNRCSKKCVTKKARAELDFLFDRNWVGVAFEPYYDYPFPKSTADYSMDEIKAMLRVIHNRFRHISTYSMGTEDAGAPWQAGKGNCRIAQAAAELNRDEGKDFLVNIGVYQFPNNPALQQTEINNAFAAAASANAARPGTVWGITFTNEYFEHNPEAGYVLNLVGTARGRNSGLELGTRSHFCDQIHGGELQGVLQQMAREFDFIYCNVYATNDVDGDVGATNVGGRIINMRNAFWQQNSGLDFRIGETGWASEQPTWQKTVNNLENMKRYWKGMNEFAMSNEIQVQMFEGIDEEWKGKDENNDGAVHEGHGGEAHYGWWRKNQLKIKNDYVYIEKVTGIRYNGVNGGRF